MNIETHNIRMMRNFLPCVLAKALFGITNLLRCYERSLATSSLPSTTPAPDDRFAVSSSACSRPNELVVRRDPGAVDQQANVARIRRRGRRRGLPRRELARPDALYQCIARLAERNECRFPISRTNICTARAS